MRKAWWLLVPAIVLLGWLWARSSTPPQVPFTRATREKLVSTLNTNGKVEPVESAAVRAEVAAAVERIHVQRGQTVVKGQLLVTLNAGEARADLATAHSRIAQARAELETVSAGGRESEKAEIESGLVRARADLANAKREQEVLRRLVEKKAATQADLTAAAETVERAQLQIQALERKRKALVSAPDKSASEARLQEAESGATAATRRIGISQLRSPISGVVYHLDIKPGAYVNPGDLVAQVGRLNKLRVVLYVDEPELGRVQTGMPVTITWDALPEREWKGQVETTPLQVVPLGTRQVGEVICTIENADLSLIPGTNINAEIRSSVVENAVTLPKEALRREKNVTGVLKLDGKKVAWQPVRLGVSSITRVQILEGVGEGDAVALPIDLQLRSGDEVIPVF